MASSARSRSWSGAPESSRGRAGNGDGAERRSRPKVLYISSAGHGGSTLLDLVLGQLEGWFSCGELCTVWDNDLCSCGRRAHECEFWGPVLEAVLSEHESDAASASALLRHEERGPAPRAVAAIELEARRVASGDPPRLRSPALLRTLYSTLQAATGAKVIAESSKRVNRLAMLARLTDVDLYVVHLVRDPRAIVHAWRRRTMKSADPPTYSDPRGRLQTATWWLKRNAFMSTIGRRWLGDRYLLLRYEDLAADPASALRSVCTLLGQAETEIPVVGDRTVPLTTSVHSVSGNFVRFSRDEVVIEPDRRWMREIDRRTNLVASLVSAPLRARFGYPLRWRAAYATEAAEGSLSRS